MEQFDQLLTCCICLDRYRNPKLLPCQHSYCMEPCMEGLVDYVKRQVRPRDEMVETVETYATFPSEIARPSSAMHHAHCSLRVH